MAQNNVFKSKLSKVLSRLMTVRLLPNRLMGARNGCETRATESSNDDREEIFIRQTLVFPYSFIRISEAVWQRIPQFIFDQTLTSYQNFVRYILTYNSHTRNHLSLSNTSLYSTSTFGSVKEIIKYGQWNTSFKAVSTFLCSVHFSFLWTVKGCSRVYFWAGWINELIFK